MEKKLAILHLEDNKNDALMIEYYLKKAVVEYNYTLVENKDDFLSHLHENVVDIILSDYNLPGYSGKEALEYVKVNFPDIPFVFISGTMGEDAAIDSLLNGATDYVLKGKLEKLPSAVIRSLRESELSKQNKYALEELRKNELQYRTLVEGMNEGLLTAGLDDKIIFVNKQFCELTGYEYHELIGETGFEFLCNKETQKIITEKNKIRNEGIKDIYEIQIINKSGENINVRVKGSPLYDTKNIIIGSIATFENIDEIKKVENKLNKHEILMQSIIDSIPDLIFYKDINSKYLGCNKGFEYTTGIKIEYRIGKTDADFYKKESYELFHETDRKVIETRNSEYFEEWVVLPDGKKILYETIKSPLYGSDKEIIGIVGVCRDITERKKTEIIIKESEEKYRKIFDNNPVGILHYDIEAKITACNERFIQIMGSSRNLLIGLNLQKLKNEKVVSAISESLKGIDASYEGLYLSITGNKTTFLNAHFSPVLSGENKIIGGIGLVEDITEKMKSKETILLQTKALETAANAIVITDKNGDIQWVNPAFLNLTNYSYNEVIGKNPREILKSDKHEASFYEEMWSTINAAKPWKGQLINRKKDNTLYYEEIIITPITNENNEITHFIAIKQDVSERIKSEKELIKAKEKAEASDRLKTAFMNNISHEIRTPLNGILGFGQLICEPGLNDEEKQQYLGILQLSSDRLISTVTDYIDASLIVSGNLEVNKNSFNMMQFIRKLDIITSAKCRMKNIEFEIYTPENCQNIEVYSDESLLLKIMNHLLDNAVKFTEKGKISFGFSKDDINLNFYVKDTGIGICMEKISLLFDYFIQENSSMNRGYEGSGLGLAIAKGMVLLLGGNINVESSKGVGSTFYVSIPFGNINNDNLLTEIVSMKKIDEPLVLIAEDDDDNFLLLETLFRKTKIKYLRATNGIESIEIFKSDKDINLVLMDLKMPDMNGYEATRQIKLLNPDIPVIAVTAYALSGDEQLALDAGCDDYIEKPIKKNLLFSKLEKYGIYSE